MTAEQTATATAGSKPTNGAQPMLEVDDVHTFYGQIHALKGITLRAQDASRDLKHSINLISEDMARQVKRHRDKRRGRREARAASEPMPFEPPMAEPPGGAAAAF